MRMLVSAMVMVWFGLSSGGGRAQTAAQAAAPAAPAPAAAAPATAAKPTDAKKLPDWAQMNLHLKRLH